MLYKKNLTKTIDNEKIKFSRGTSTINVIY